MDYEVGENADCQLQSIIASNTITKRQLDQHHYHAKTMRHLIPPTYFSCTLAIVTDLPQLHNAAVACRYHPTASVMSGICHLSIDSDLVNNRLQIWAHPCLVPANWLLQPGHRDHITYNTWHSEQKLLLTNKQNGKMVNGSRYYTALESISIASALTSALTIYPCQIRVHQRWQSKLQLPTARKKEWRPATERSSSQAVTCQHCDTHYFSRLRTHNLPTRYQLCHRLTHWVANYTCVKNENDR